MTRKVYKTAMGKEVDLGSLLLQNEHVRAVGNMNVNARGDLLDGSNRVIDQKNRQVQRQYKRTTSNVTSAEPIYSSSKAAKQANADALHTDLNAEDIIEELLPTAPIAESVVAEPIVQPAPVTDPAVPAVGGGLAAAIARSRTIKQEKEKTLREKAREQQIKRI